MSGATRSSPPSAGSGSVQHNGAAVANPNFVDVTKADLVALGAGLGVVPTATKTGAYTAAAGDLVPVDTTGGAVTITLPSAPPNGTRIAVKLTAGSAPVTVARGGTDVFATGGGTTVTLTLVREGVLLQYATATGLWFVLANDLPLSGLDSRYALAGTTGSGIDLWSPTGAIAETHQREAAVTAIPLASGTLRLSGGIVIPAATTVSTITVSSQATAATAPTNQWCALYRASDRALLAVSDDKTTAAWAAHTAKTFTLATPYTPAGAIAVYVGVVVVATTTPSIAGANVPAGVSGLTLILGGNSTAALTTPATAPATAGAINAASAGGPCYAYVA